MERRRIFFEQRYAQKSVKGVKKKTKRVFLKGLKIASSWVNAGHPLSMGSHSEGEEERNC